LLAFGNLKEVNGEFASSRATRHITKAAFHVSTVIFRTSNLKLSLKGNV